MSRNLLVAFTTESVNSLCCSLNPWHENFVLNTEGDFLLGVRQGGKREMISGIDPKVDFAFKRVFGNEHNLPILAHLLNAVLKTSSGFEIIDLKLLNPYTQKEAAEDKLSIVDVRVRDSLGRQIDIETQLIAKPGFSSRILYYWSRLHLLQLKKSDHYLSLRPTICICIVNFKLFPDFEDYYMDFELRAKSHDCVFSKDIEVITLEVPKFTVPVTEIRTPLEQWMHFLRFGDKLDIDNLPKTITSPEIHEALEALLVLSKDRLERERYEARMRVLRDEHSALAGTRQIALAEGIEKGLEKGLEKGRKQGRQEGRQEEALSLVLRLLKRRIGKLGAETESQVRVLNVEKLEVLSEALLDFNSDDDLSKWLL